MPCALLVDIEAQEKETEALDCIHDVDPSTEKIDENMKAKRTKTGRTVELLQR